MSCCRSKSAMPELQMRPRVDGFAEDAQAAMAASPGYFATWDVIKTAGLVAAVTALVAVSGKKRRRSKR